MSTADEMRIATTEDAEDTGDREVKSLLNLRVPCVLCGR
jgi:hypothetical protein